MCVMNRLMHSKPHGLLSLSFCDSVSFYHCAQITVYGIIYIFIYNRLYYCFLFPILLTNYAVSITLSNLSNASFLQMASLSFFWLLAATMGNLTAVVCK